VELDSLLDTQIKTVSAARSVYQTICYFDIFKYPLKAAEVREFCTEKISEDCLLASLGELIAENKIVKVKDYYLLSEKDQENISKRASSEVHLARKLSRIKRFARLVSAFPFVEAVYISGSVSKGLLDSNGDVDYFIIARASRVWLCRTLLIAFKKIILLNSRKYFCVNYFIDTQNLTVPDNNLFVATEIVTLVPVTENDVVKEFEASNSWARRQFPNMNAQKRALISRPLRKPLLSRCIESVCIFWPGEKLDNYFFRRTLQRWQKKFPHFNRNEFDLNMRSYKNVSKHHPQGHQVKVLNALAEHMRKFD
jgi:hypothetical protein